ADSWNPLGYGDAGRYNSHSASLGVWALLRRFRLRTRNALTFGAALLVIAGCNSGGGSGRDSSTAAPINSSTTPGGGANPGIPGYNPNQLTDALVSSFGQDELIHVDALTGQAGSRWATGNGPIDVANWGNDAYVANSLSQDLTV